MSAKKLRDIISSPDARASLENRFWKKVGGREGGCCWPWLGKATMSKFGYGAVNIGDGVVTGAHRVAFALHYGYIDDGAVIRHSCDNPKCCNPAHLLSGTHADNVSDMMARGRHVARRDTPEIRKIISDGRKNGKRQEITDAGRKLKIEATKRMWQNSEIRERIIASKTGKNNHNYGKKLKRKPGVTEKIVATRRANGYRPSEETKEKMRQAAIGRPSAKKGKKLSPETIERMRIAWRKRSEKKD